MRKLIVVCGTALVTALSAPAAVQAASFTEINVFGDSLSDIGNIYDLTSLVLPEPVPAPPYYQGRFSNGPIYADVLADRLGLTLDNSLGGGSNFAFGGAGTDFQAPMIPDFAPLSIESQVSQFLLGRALSGTPIGEDELFVVWGGSNNVQLAIDDDLDTATVVDNAIGDLAGIVSTLQAFGAQTILVPNIPNLSRTPVYAGLQRAEEVTVAFNTALSSLDGPGVEIFDVFGLLEEAVMNPALFGVDNVTDRCFTGDDLLGFTDDDTQCATPETYLFWDDLHPSATAHAFLGEAMASFLMPAPQPVPIPGALALFGSALASIVAMAGLRRT